MKNPVPTVENEVNGRQDDRSSEVYFKMYPYFLNHLAMLGCACIIDATLIAWFSGGMGATNGGIPLNFIIISIGFFPAL
jgi:hypothetical protein